MAHRLNTNKQFMVGNGILAFAVIFVIVLFLYITMRAQRAKDPTPGYYTEKYTISLVSGFANDSVSVYINDSLLVNQRIIEEPFVFEVSRFADQSALMIVDNATDRLSTFDLSEKGGEILLTKDSQGIKQMAR